MTRKIRDIMKDLRDNGFELVKGEGKGDHKKYIHPEIPGTMYTLDGEPGDDVHPYQEKQLNIVIAKTRSAGC